MLWHLKQEAFEVLRPEAGAVPVAPSPIYNSSGRGMKGL